MRIDPRLQILYLLGVAIFAFAASHSLWLLGLLALQVALWLAAGFPVMGLVAIFRKLVVFFFAIVVSFAFFAAEPGDRYLSLFGWGLEVNLTGIVRGLLFSSRIVTVIYASRIIQRAGDGTALVRGLRGLFVPAFFAYSLDMVLSLVARDERGGGRRRRRGGEPEDKAQSRREALDVLRRVLRGDVGFLVEAIQRNIARARERAESYGLRPEAVSDLAVITGLAVVSMTVRALHVLPGLPVAPGHKGIMMLPLYLVAYELTSPRWGATRLGIVIGVTSFLMGEGKFGVFEILRHIASGLFVDVAMRLVRTVSREPGAIVYSAVGIGAALARLSTIIAVGYFVDVPSVFYAFLIPQAISHSVFGFLSGFVTYHLMKSIQKLRAVL